MSVDDHEQVGHDSVAVTTLQKIVEVGQAVLKTQDLQQLLPDILAIIGPALGADVVILYEYREITKDVQVPPVTWGELRHPEILQERGQAHKDSVVFLLLEKGEAFFASHAGQDWGLRLGKEPPFIAREGIASSCALPLIANDEKVGILFINYRVPHARDSMTEIVIQAFCTQAAIAIRSARRFGEELALRRHAEELRDIAGATSPAAELEETGGRILHELRELVEYRKASVQVIQGDSRKRIAYRGAGTSTMDQWLLRPVSSDRLVKRIVESQEPVILSDTASVEEWGIHPATEDVRSWIGLPLVYGGRTIGLVTLDHDRAGFYTDALRNVLASFAQRVAEEVWRAYLSDLRQRRIQDQQIISEVVQAVNSQLDRREILQTLVSQIARQLRCAHCTLFVQREQAGESWLVPQVTDGPIAEQVKDWRFRPDEDLAGWVYQRGEPLLLQNAMDDPRLSFAWEDRGKPRSMLAVPVQIRNEVVGVLSAEQAESGWFSESDLRLVKTLVEQAGLAIERASSLALLHDINSHILSAPDVGETLRQIVIGAIQLTDTMAGVIYLLTDDAGAISQSFDYPREFVHPPPRMSDAGGITRHIIDTGQWIQFPDLSQDLDVNPELLKYGVRSMIGVPLKLEMSVIGVLYLNDRVPRTFTEIEISLLSTLASQAAIAIQKARSFSREQTLRQQEEILRSVSGQLLHCLDLREVSRFVVEGIGDLFEVASCVVRLYDRATDRFTPLTASGKLQDVLDQTPRRKGSSRYVVQFKKPRYLVGDELRDPTDGGPPIRRNIRDRGIQSIAYLPLLGRDDIIGVLYVDLETPHRFSEDERRFLWVFANQAAIAIENAQLFQAQTEFALQLERLHNVMATILTRPLDLDRVLFSVADGLVAIFPGASCFIRLYDAETGEFVPMAANGDLKDLLRVPVSKDGSSRYVVDTKKARFLTGDQLRHPTDDGPPIREDIIGSGVQAIAYLPLVSRGSVIGILYVDLPRPYTLSTNDRRVLEVFAEQATVAIENVDLVLQSINAASEIGRMMPSHDIDRILEQVHTQTARSMDVRNMYVAFCEEQDGEVSISFPLAYSNGQRVETGDGAWAPSHRAKFPDLVEKRGPEEPQYALTWRIMDHGKPEYSPGNLKQWAQEQGIELSPGISARSWVGVPLRIGKQVVGVISALSDEQADLYDQDDVRILEAMANLASVAIDNMKLYREREEACQNLEREQERRIADAKFVSLGQVAGGIAHRINNAIPLVSLCAGDIRRHLGTPDDYVEQQLAMIERNAGYILDLAEELRKPTRESRSGYFDVNGLIQDAVEAANVPCSMAKLSLTEDLPQVHTQRLLVEVFVELITNALKAMETSRTKRLEVGSRTIDGNYVEVWFTDTGPGIPPEKQEKIFDLFYSTGGTGRGFGLWWVRTFLAMQGGQITVESEPGKGATFRVTLPMKAKQ